LKVGQVENLLMVVLYMFMLRNLMCGDDLGKSNMRDQMRFVYREKGIPRKVVFIFLRN